MVSVLLLFVHLCISHGPQAACKCRSVTVRNDPMLLRLVRMCCKSRRTKPNGSRYKGKVMFFVCESEREIMCVQVCMHVLLHTSSRESRFFTWCAASCVSVFKQCFFFLRVCKWQKKIIEPMIVFKQEISWKLFYSLWKEVWKGGVRNRRFFWR